MDNYVDIVFDGPPGPEAPRFIEVEGVNGESTQFGEWHQRNDGYWVLRVFHEPAKLNDLRDMVHSHAIVHGWWEGDNANFLSKLCLVHTEISEACEAYRSEGPDNINKVWYNANRNNKPEGVPPELSDAIIRILDICGFYNIDIEAAVQEKAAFNVGREYRHGNKFA